jgi:predicted flap endonuclease-1-like 5' DNA nuclease
MADLTTVEGIGESYEKKLQEAGVGSTKALLEQGATPGGRKEIAEKTGIDDKLILRWVNHVDLFRIKGIGGEYAELLEAGGVDTVPELAQRNGENLFQKLESVNREKNLVRKLPTLSQVNDWIAQAKQLPRLVTY